MVQKRHVLYAKGPAQAKATFVMGWLCLAGSHDRRYQGHPCAPEVDLRRPDGRHGWTRLDRHPDAE